MIRHLGYACQNLTLGPKVLSNRTVRLKNVTRSKISELSLLNARDLLSIIKWNVENDIYFFRIGSGIFPFMDHYEVGYSFDDILPAQRNEIKEILKQVGELAKKEKIRLSCHPGPYTCLASPVETTLERSIMHIKMHDLLADLMDLGPEFAINIHVGGSYDSKQETAKRFVEAYNTFSDNLKQRLTLENDDKASMWSISDLYHNIHLKCKIKLVLDIHHHKFCQSESLLDAAKMAFDTWSEFSEIPKVHYSESRIGSRPQAHSDWIVGPIPSLGDMPYDVMLETKMKEKALLGFRNSSVLSSSSV